jgi:hypothetical protein
VADLKPGKELWVNASPTTMRTEAMLGPKGKVGLITAEALVSGIGLGEFVRQTRASIELATCSFLLWTGPRRRRVDRRFAVLGPSAD